MYGQLTATLQFADSDLETVETILPAVVRLAGRIIANGFPTGVEVNSAMQHGGPYPASTDSRSTSVGTAAIQRFVRPVAFQNFPMTLLPTALKMEN
jgi:NADP-dependent aldehyde dehydrogenase